MHVMWLRNNSLNKVRFNFSLQLTVATLMTGEHTEAVSDIICYDLWICPAGSALNWIFVVFNYIFTDSKRFPFKNLDHLTAQGFCWDSG